VKARLLRLARLIKEFRKVAIATPVPTMTLTEKQSYMIEAALHHGFEMANADGTAFFCTERQIVALLTPYHLLHDARKLAVVRAIAQRTTMSVEDIEGWVSRAYASVAVKA
jgi:hypothetical protein